MVPLSSHGVSRVPRYSGFDSLILTSLTWLSHSSVCLPIHFSSLKWILNVVQNPGCIATSGLASSAFARHYSQNLGWFLFLALLRCFSSGGSPPYAIDSHMDAWTTSCGLLHSEISGSMLAYNSPLLIAVNHVLLRLSMPRHSLCALLCFTICSFGSSQNFRVQLFVVFFTQHFGYSPSCRCFYLLVVFTCICFHYSVFKLHFFLSFSKNRYQQMIFFSSTDICSCKQDTSFLHNHFLSKTIV